MNVMKFRQLIIRNKRILYGEEIYTGGKKWIFSGAGKDNILFRHSVFGLDVTQASSGKFWVEYQNINPVVAEQLLNLIAEHKQAIQNLNGESDELKNIYKKTASKTQLASKERELGFIRASELE